MNRLMESLQTKNTFTENAMPTHSTSSSACLDWFGCVGSARSWSDDQIINCFVKALSENTLVALRTLFWARDVREGAGERRVFRVCLDYLNRDFRLRSLLEKNIHLVPEYGRWDDLFHIENNIVLQLIAGGIVSDDGLLAKWLPRKGPFANKVRRYLELSPRDYRKMLVKLSKTVEQDMCSKNWSSIKYEQVPSVAMHKYRKAFARNDNERFVKFISRVVKGETTIKAGVLFPYQLYQGFKRGEDGNALQAQWQNLPNFMEGNEKLILPMCDTSASMKHSYNGFYGGLVVPMDVSVSLGVYISERNEGPFKDCFLTFSSKPTLQNLSGGFVNRCKQLEKAHWEQNTDLEATFSYLLDVAVANNIPAHDMPGTILILSDMQFDRCTRFPKRTAFEMIKGNYRRAGYEVPEIVFWNIDARVDKNPVKYNDTGVALVSGCSPTVLKSVLDGSISNPIDLMLRTVMSERYENITV